MPGGILSGRPAVIVKVVTGFHGTAKRGLVRVEPGWGGSGGPICTGPPAHLCSVDLTQRWMTCPTWVLLPRPVGRLRTLLAGAALQSASQLAEEGSQGAPMWAHGQQWAVVFGSMLQRLVSQKRIFTSSEHELTGEESKGGGRRSLNLQHIVRVSGCHGLNPPSRQVWRSEGLQEQREALRPPTCLHTDHLPNFLLLRDLAFPAHHAGGLFSVEACEKSAFEKEKGTFPVDCWLCVCVCVYVCVLAQACVRVCLLNGILFL